MNLIGSVNGLAALGLLGLGGVAVLLAVNGWARRQRARQARDEVLAGTVEAAPAYRRYVTVAVGAGGSWRHWDHSVRPLLAELVETAVAERHPAASDHTALARERLGPQLWALVDPNAARTADARGPGPGRDALRAILERVNDEQW